MVLSLQKYTKVFAWHVNMRTNGRLPRIVKPDFPIVFERPKPK
jgi:hypothetical protein